MIYEGFLWHPYFGTDFQTTVCQQNLRISEKLSVSPLSWHQLIRAFKCATKTYISKNCLSRERGERNLPEKVQKKMLRVMPRVVQKEQKILCVILRTFSVFSTESSFFNLRFIFLKGYVQLERAVGKNEKLESFKLESLKLESLAEVGKNRAKLERTQRSWKEPSEVGKNRAKLGRTKRSQKVSFGVGKFR